MIQTVIMNRGVKLELFQNELKISIYRVILTLQASNYCQQKVMLLR